MKSRKKSSVIENKGVFNFSVKKENEAKLLICHYYFPRRPILDFSTRTSTIVYRHQPRPLLSQSEESALLAGFLKATMTWTLSPNSTTPVCGNRTCHPRTCKCHGEWKTAYYNHKVLLHSVLLSICTRSAQYVWICAWFKIAFKY